MYNLDEVLKKIDDLEQQLFVDGKGSYNRGVIVGGEKNPDISMDEFKRRYNNDLIQLYGIRNQIIYKKNEGFDFIDLFCGIGAFHYALKNNYTVNCVFASEIDPVAAKTYEDNHGITPHGDITKITEYAIPYHDILCAGFPCQPFSIAGKKEGFEDEKKGNLFFEIIRIIKRLKPPILLLENVPNIETHDEGRTFKTILRLLKEQGYKNHYKVLAANDYGLATSRKRMYIVSFIDHSTPFEFPRPLNSNRTHLIDILEDDPQGIKIADPKKCKIRKKPTYEKSLFGDLWLPNSTVRIGEYNGGLQGQRIYDPHGVAITFLSNSGGLGGNTGLYKINGAVRTLSPRECARCMGFPESHIMPASNSQAIKQFGNSIPINVIEAILENIPQLTNNKRKNNV